MALSFDHGAIQWVNTDAVNTIFTISGLSFQPKALRFYWVGIQSSTDATSDTRNSNRGVGFAMDTSNRRCVSSLSLDASGSGSCVTAASNDCVVCALTSGARIGLLDLNSITSDGFTLIVDDDLGTSVFDLTIFWEAWGGSDITVAAVGDIAEPAATGDQDYTVTGFVASATDQIVMFAGVQSVAALNSVDSNDSGMHVGFATSATAADNITVCGNSDDGSATMDTDGYCQDGECLSMIVIGGGTSVNARATLTQFGTDNFRLNWAARATTNRRTVFLAIKGGKWKSGSYTIDMETAGATATVSGLSFAPIGVSLIGRRSLEQTAGTSITQDLIGFGSGTSPSSRRTQAMHDLDASGTSTIGTRIEYDQILAFTQGGGAEFGAFDLNAMNSDGFQIIVDTATVGVPNQWQGYLTFGNAAVSAVQAPLLSGSERYMRTGG